MCRWIAYRGRPIFMDELLFRPQNSLVNQSLLCRKGAAATNGDGFGVGWWRERDTPGLYRDLRPAWNDDNLRNLAEQIRSGLFFAHVRASTGTATQRTNCHPFRWGRWLFMHNGKIGGYDKVRRRLEGGLPDALYAARTGCTDSELFFLMAVAQGLEEDPAGALARAAGGVEAAMRDVGETTDSFTFTAALSDGNTIWAVRYASWGTAPTLFWAEGASVSVCPAEGCCRFGAGRGATLILSEPLDAANCWREVPQGGMIVADDQGVSVSDFHPASPAVVPAAAE